MDTIARGIGHVFRIPLISKADATIFNAAPTLAAGDAKAVTRNAFAANLTAEYVAFTSGSVEPLPYEILTGATSGTTAKVVGTVVTSGTWGAGTAAGALFLEAVSAAFQAENLNGSVAGANCMTIGGDCTVALMADLGNLNVAIPITSAEATLPFRGVGDVIVHDQTSPIAWNDTQIRFENRDERDGVAFEGYIALGGSVSAFTLVGPASELTRVAVGYSLCPEGIPAQPILTYNSGTGAGTTASFVSDPSGKRCVAYIAAPLGATADFSTTQKASITTAVPTAAANAAATRDVSNATPAGSSLGAVLNTVAATLLNPAGFKKNTAVVDFSFPMKDEDGNLVSGLTVTGKIQKDGSAFAALTSAIAEVGTTGIYQLTAASAILAAEMNADQVMLLFTATGAKPTTIEIYTEP
jgi:hypothetical protein